MVYSWLFNVRAVKAPLQRRKGAKEGKGNTGEKGRCGDGREVPTHSAVPRSRLRTFPLGERQKLRLYFNGSSLRKHPLLPKGRPRSSSCVRKHEHGRCQCRKIPVAKRGERRREEEDAMLTRAFIVTFGRPLLIGSAELSVCGDQRLIRKLSPISSN